MSREMLNRINELTRKKRSIGLSDQENAEQKQLYAEYLLNVQCQLISLPEKFKSADVVEQEFKNNSKPVTKVFQQTQIVIGQKIFH